jgi:hypothetical protein
VADWLGDSDLAALRPYFELSGDPVVLLLDRPSGDEQHAVLQAEGLNAGDADAFLREANDRALSDLLKNPQNLIMQKEPSGWLGTQTRRSRSPIVPRLARHLGLLIEHRRWTHCGVESVANLPKRLADYIHSARRLLAQVSVLVDRFDKRLLAHGNQVP